MSEIDEFKKIVNGVSKKAYNCMGLFSMMVRKVAMVTSSTLQDGVCGVVVFEGEKYFITVKPYKEKV